MATLVCIPHSQAEERFYLDAIRRVQFAAEKNIPAEKVFEQMKAEVAQFNAVLADKSFHAAAVDVLKKKLASLNADASLSPQVIQATIDGIFAERLAAQNHLAQLLANPAFRSEVQQRVGAKEPMAYMLVSHEEADALAGRYKQAVGALGKVGLASAIMGERMLQQAVALTFNGGDDKPLLKPLMEAINRTQATGRDAADLAESFLNSRTVEAITKTELLKPDGWVMQQVQQSWVGKTAERSPRVLG